MQKALHPLVIVDGWTLLGDHQKQTT